MTLSLERRAVLWGDRLAVVDADADRRVSYADLESEADAMARRLSSLGVGPGDAVAVLSRNRIETLALSFAVRRLGGVLAPVSHRLTPATVEEPLETVEPTVVVHEAAQRDLVRELSDDLGHSFEEFGRIDGEDYERADRDPEDSLLYLHEVGRADRPAVGETGGGEDGVGESSGKDGDDGDHRRGESLNENPQTASRVVDVPERAVEWNCITAAAAWGLGKDDCAPTLLPVSDADGLLRLVLPLLYVGGRVDLLRVFDPDDALAAIADEGATAAFAGATEYRELVGSDAFEAADFGSVEWFGSRSALPEDVREALAREAPVVRAYGRVETGPNDLFVPPERASEDAGSTDPDFVGRPFPDCEVRVIDPEGGRPVSEGETGELQFRGPVTARGYLSNEGVEEFPNWVPTGDLAYRENGDYYLLGPAGETVESASERVHPRQVERALEAREDVTAAGVVPHSEGVLVAFVGNAGPGELQSVAADALPEGATVREINRVDSLPRRPTGEPDRAEIRRQFEGEERFEKD
jgi:acyl-CoA synthetase (AMP-forming)/AMP-acid ligase II